MNAERVRSLVGQWADRFASERDRLGALDAATGDGDHGAGMQRGFARAREAVLDLDPAADVGAVLAEAGRGLMTGVGGASGALFATVLLEVAKAAASAAVLTSGHLAQGMASALERIGRLGRSAPGDKTMLDALAPAVAVLQERGTTGSDEMAAALRAAALAAAEGAESTREMVARQGRARHVQGAGAGHLDPGAVSLSILLDVWATVASGGDS